MLVESGVVIISYAELDYIIGHGYSWWATLTMVISRKSSSGHLKLEGILAVTSLV